MIDSMLTNLPTPHATLAFGKGEWIGIAFLVAAVLFILGLKKLGSVKTAVRGNQTSAAGMLVACVVTFFFMTGGEAISLIWIAIALGLGGTIGFLLATRVQMTGMPQMVGLLNGFGGIASLLVAVSDYSKSWEKINDVSGGVQEMASAMANQAFSVDVLVAVGLATLIGGVTFTGSLVAFGKLQGLKITPGRPVQFAGQKAAIVAMIVISLVLTGILIANPGEGWTLVVITILALALGILLVIGIGGADMPVVVSLLNSYSGLAASMAGFALNNQLLIIVGALVGASGLILTNIMCKAMNRSLMNVLFGGVGGEVKGGGAGGDGKPQGTAREMTAEDVAIQLDAAGLVVVVPGYGMAVAQAQHVVAELFEILEDRGITCKFAIHPVAGRMPGHMNVLLAEANVPYEALCDLETINPEFEQAGVALVIGANDVTNPAARHDKASPIYGMPILDVDKARSVVVIKRSLNPGFAGIENELYFKQNCGMLFGDGKAMVTAIVSELKDT